MGAMAFGLFHLHRIWALRKFDKSDFFYYILIRVSNSKIEFEANPNQIARKTL